MNTGLLTDLARIVGLVASSVIGVALLRNHLQANRSADARSSRDELDASALISAPAGGSGQFEIRPGIWAYEDGVPPEALSRAIELHLERHGVSVECRTPAVA